VRSAQEFESAARNFGAIIRPLTPGGIMKIAHKPGRAIVFALAFGAAVGSGGGMAQDHEAWTAEQEEVWRTITAWNDAFERNDADAYFAHVDPAITVLTPANPYRVDGITADRREYEFGLKAGYSRVSLFQEMQPMVRVAGDMAYATYFNRGWYGSEPGSMMYLKETNVLVRTDGRWKIVHVHVSR
jgi:ketosteroid isomerase-like protein